MTYVHLNPEDDVFAQSRAAWYSDLGAFVVTITDVGDPVARNGDRATADLDASTTLDKICRQGWIIAAVTAVNGNLVVVFHRG